MAGDWIKMRSNLDGDWRVIAIAAELGVPELHVVGCLWKVWSWADQHFLDGNAIRVTDVTLDRFTSLTGFSAALRKVGWLEGRDSALTFPRFAEHNGQTAKKRCETAIRVAKSRNAKRVTDVTQKVLPEKRREEKTLEAKASNTPIVPNGDIFFDRFWEAFPSGRKSGKGAARKAWAIAKRKAKPDAIIAAASEYAASDVGRSEYVKGPAVWLNQECWLDDRAAWQRHGTAAEVRGGVDINAVFGDDP